MDVPALGIDAVVQPIAAKGRVLTPPSDPQQVGWWQDGAEPGAGRGRILITGHTVHTGGGAFDHLDRLRPGDPVAISAKGRWLDYRVQRVFFLTPEQLARRSSTLFGSSGPERLVLVTCAAWDGAAYDGSTVVVAVPDDVGQ